jgi:hypothetical protein
VLTAELLNAEAKAEGFLLFSIQHSAVSIAYLIAIR